jgi:hypothetical protein
MESTAESAVTFQARLIAFARTRNKNLSACDKGLLLKIIHPLRVSRGNDLIQFNVPNKEVSYSHLCFLSGNSIRGRLYNMFCEDMR